MLDCLEISNSNNNILGENNCISKGISKIKFNNSGDLEHDIEIFKKINPEFLEGN